MSATQIEAAPVPRLELASGLDLRARQLRAVGDLREAASLWRLCATLGWLDIRLRYRGSLLGPFWLTLSTAVMVGALGFLYAALYKMPLADLLPFLATSIVLWNFLSSLVGEACTCFVDAEGTIRSMRMPFALHAARVVVRNSLVFGHNIVVIIGVFLIFRIWPGVSGLLAVPGLALWVLDALMAGLLLGTFCARFRDIPPIVGSIMQIAFFVSPVIWKPDMLGPGAHWLPFNPFFSLLEVVRGPLLDGVPSATVYLSAVGYSLALWIAAWLLFARVRGRLAFWV